MFIAPFFLIAAGIGAVVPLVLHMMQTRKRVQIPFPTLRFLQLAQKQSSRRIKIENFLLWLIRTLIMLFLGMAFAMPILRKEGFAWLGDSPRDVAIVIDASYSMDYNTGRDTVWNKSLDAARSIIEGLGENDRFCLYLAREQPEALVSEPVGDKEMGLGRLETIETGSGSSQLAPAVAAAVKALRKDQRGRELELHVITDNQALPWDSFGGVGKGGGGGSAWDPDLLDDRTGLFVTLLGVSAPENTGPAAVELLPPIVRPGSPAQVNATLTRTGQGAQSAATLFINGEQRARRAIGGDSSGGSAPTFVLPPLPVGVHEARIETPSDNLPIDDAFHFLVRVEEQRPTLCVGTSEDTFFVRTALRTAAGRDAAPPLVVSPDQVGGEPLDQFACIILCNALPVPGQAIGALEEFVRGGGLLVIFPGMRASVDSYTSWNCLPGKPVAVSEVPLSMRRRILSWDKPRHAMLRSLRKGGDVPPLTVRRSLVWEKLPAETETLVSAGSGQPFLLDRPFGDGRVLLFAVPADRSWSDFPLSPFYLPLLVQGIDYSAGLGSKEPYYWAGETLPLTGLVPEGSRGVSLIGPNKREVPIRSAMQDGRTRLFAEDLVEPGIYTLSGPGLPADAKGFAVNLRRHESDLTPLAPGALDERLGVKRLQVATDLASLERLVEEHRLGRAYGEHLLWAALILAIIEFSLANILLRKSSTLSEKLDVDVSGQVKGHA
jgi:hypothetical protein